jgi:hypothetical protein
MGAFLLFDVMRLSQTIARADRGLMRRPASQNAPPRWADSGVSGHIVVSCLL